MNERPTLALVKPAQQFGAFIKPEVFFDVPSALGFRAEVFSFSGTLGDDAVPHLATHYIDEADVADAFIEFDCHNVRI